MEYKINYKGYEFNITQNVDGTFNIPDDIKELEPFGTSMKPANEPICVARKPLSEKSVAENVLKWGTGGINIDGCRIGTDDKLSRPVFKSNDTNIYGGGKGMPPIETLGNEEGRFPANIILDETAAELLDEQSGMLASRFFYVAKVSKKERNLGLDGFEDKETSGQVECKKCIKCNRYYQAGDGRELCTCNEPEYKKPTTKNTHPTVKPINLMTYLCRLITPENGIVLDPFMGSGSTGIAAQLEGFRFCGLEMDEDYFKIAEARIENYKLYEKFIK